ETYTVEGYNSLFRHFLARLCRKSNCYSKKQSYAQIFLCF
ncbi:IS1 family transposase, partial [Methylobacter sp. BlB1]|nr:IS1 family transposase [Methylobacter sp. BlB1]